MSQSDTNVVVLCGRLTKDAEAAGNSGDIAKIRLAVNGWAKDGEDAHTNFIDVTKFKATNLIPHLTKGKQILVTGRLEFREWETAEGGKRNALSVVAQELQFVGSKPEGEAPAAPADDTPDWAKDEN